MSENLLDVGVVVIGDEILIGQIVDTNSGFISKALASLGWRVGKIWTVADSSQQISVAMRQAMQECRVVLTTGGLGPTKDDITKSVLVDIFGGSLSLDEQVLSHVCELFAQRGLVMNDLTKEQALVPTACEVIPNRMGTAPAMWFEDSGRILVAMPGVPSEMRHIVTNELLPRFKSRFAVKVAHGSVILIINGISESALAEKIAPWEDALEQGIHLAYLPQSGYLKLRVDCDAPSEGEMLAVLEQACGWLRHELGSYIIADEDLSPAEIVLKRLNSLGLTLATAESCTGGAISSAITSVPGASSQFMGSVVAYSNEVKRQILHVDGSLIERYGAVSQPVVEAMAGGVASLLQADCAIATSGVAGPGGGTPDKPVGTVWFGIYYKGEVCSFVKRFIGGRAQVVERAVNCGLFALLHRLPELRADVAGV